MSGSETVDPVALISDLLTIYETRDIAEHFSLHPWGSLARTPSNQEWEMGSTAYIAVNTSTANLTSVDSQTKMIAEIERLQAEMGISCHRLLYTLSSKVDSSHTTLLHKTLLSLGYSAEVETVDLMGWSANSLSVPLTESAESLPKIRQATETDNDLAAIVKLVGSNQPDIYGELPWHVKYQSRRLQAACKNPDSGVILLLEATPEKVPAAFAAFWKMDKDSALLMRIDTLAKFRRRGYAKRILEFGLHHCVNKWGVKNVYLTVIDDGARNLYKKLGFTLLDSVQECVFIKEDK